jgi:hypothetical protein
MQTFARRVSPHWGSMGSPTEGLFDSTKRNGTSMRSYTNEAYSVCATLEGTIDGNLERNLWHYANADS